MTKYYLFSKNEININKKIDKYNIMLSNERIKRIFNFSDKIEIGTYTLLVVELDKEELVSRVEFSQFFNDCNIEIANMIENYNLFGYSSISQNKKIESIIDFDNIKHKGFIESLHGEENWNSLTEFFNCLNNSGIRYVSLRKNENLPNGFIDGDKDIDILCDNKYDLVRLFGLKKRSLGVSGYKIIVKNEVIPIDVRFKGDNYFDSSWEQNILDCRILNKNNIYVMDAQNQVFSIIYHILTQKKSISSYYKDYLEQYDVITEKNELLLYLAIFMKTNGYFFRKPIDLSVYQNKKNINQLKKKIGGYKAFQNWTMNAISKMPNKSFFKGIKESIINKYSD